MHMNDALITKRTRKLTDREWTFCYSYVRHGQWERAHDDAFPDRAMNPRSQKYRTISRLRNRSAIKAEIQKLRAELRASQRATLEQHLDKLAEIRDAATQGEQYAAAVRAEELRGKALGFYVTDIRVTHELSPGEMVGRLRQIVTDNPKIVKLLPSAIMRQLDQAPAVVAVQESPESQDAELPLRED